MESTLVGVILTTISQTLENTSIYFLTKTLMTLDRCSYTCYTKESVSVFRNYQLLTSTTLMQIYVGLKCFQTKLLVRLKKTIKLELSV